LQGKEWLVGGHLTVADVVCAMPLVVLFQTCLDAGYRKAMPNVTAWMTRFVALPEVVSRLGHIKFCAKALKPVLEEKKKEEAPKPQPVAAVKKEKTEDDKDPRDEPSKFDLYNFKTLFVNSPDRRGEGMKAFFEQYVKEDYCVYFVHYEKYEGEG